MQGDFLISLKYVVYLFIYFFLNFILVSLKLNLVSLIITIMNIQLIFIAFYHYFISAFQSIKCNRTFSIRIIHNRTIRNRDFFFNKNIDNRILVLKELFAIYLFDLKIFTNRTFFN